MILKALPFLISFLTLPFALIGVMQGGAWIALSIAITLLGAPLVDSLVSLNSENLDPDIDEKRLIWHRLITWIWVPVQLCLIVTFLVVIGGTHTLSAAEIVGAAVSLGLLSGGIGITYAHELLHQQNKFERALAELALCSTLYGHFCIEHVFGHHIKVGTPDDPATSRKDQTIYGFVPRSIVLGFVSAWKIQRSQLQRRGKTVWDSANAFWRYGAWTVFWLGLSYLLAGRTGIGFFLVQAFAAVCLLEIVNYVEHYGLERHKRANGRYEPVQPHHSWNSNHRVTNFLLINLQRHSDHHYKPSRRFPALQAYSEDEAPQLPYGYPVMILAALVPPLWFSIMNPRLLAWHDKYDRLSDQLA